MTVKLSDTSYGYNDNHSGCCTVNARFTVPRFTVPIGLLDLLPFPRYAPDRVFALWWTLDLPCLNRFPERPGKSSVDCNSKPVVSQHTNSNLNLERLIMVLFNF